MSCVSAIYICSQQRAVSDFFQDGESNGLDSETEVSLRLKSDGGTSSNQSMNQNSELSKPANSGQLTIA